MKRNRILNMVMAAGIILFAMIVSMSFTACSVNDNPTPEPVIPEPEIPETPLQTPLTFEALEPGAVVTFNINTEAATNPVYYRTCAAGTWSQWSVYESNTDVTLANVGDKVQFKGDNDSYYSDATIPNSASRFLCPNACKVYGNIMSLIDSDDFEHATTLTEPYALSALFVGSMIQIDPENPLLLPATKLSPYCYFMMFTGCRNLQYAPELPATTLAERCYAYMFSLCRSLTTAPKLPATKLDKYCYYKMFMECSSLTSAPELPATELAEGCYYCMLSDCTSLTTAPELPATKLADKCYGQMLAGCTALTEPSELPATKLANECYSLMYQNCTALTEAPELPATTLAKQCYFCMFAGCSALTKTPELPATTLAEECYLAMFLECSGLTKASDLPATELAESCYDSMFGRCENLTDVPEGLPAKTLAKRCYDSMFYGCKSMVYAPILPATTLADSCYSEMFFGCEKLECFVFKPDFEMPIVLPAETLTKGCYYNMFAGCSSLRELKCYATDISAEDCTKDWLSGVSTSGYFTTYSYLPWEENSPNGIPAGWRRHNIDGGDEGGEIVIIK